MRIEITQDPSGTGDYRWELHTGPERIDSYTGYCYSLGECFEEIVKWNTLNALHYTEETETEKLNLLHHYKKQTPDVTMKLHEQLTQWYYTHNAVQSGDVIANEIVNVVKCWLKTHHREETKYDADYNAGWMDCIETLEKDAR